MNYLDDLNQLPRDLWDIIPVPFFIKSPDGYIFYNRSFKNLFPTPGPPPVSELFPLNTGAVNQKIDQLLQHSNTIEKQMIELPLQCKDLMIRTFQINLSRFTFKDQTIVVGGTLLDITTRDRMEQLLMGYHQKMEALLAAAHDAIIALNENRELILWNRHATKMFGYSINDIFEQPVQLLLPDHHNYLILEEGIIQLQQELLPPDELRIELLLKNRSGQIFPAELSLNTYRSDQSRAYLLIIRDTTTQNHREQELTRAKKVAEKASQVKGEFLANISHEIRTPLNGISGMLSLLLDTELSAEQQELVTVAKESSNTLIHLMENILNFSTLKEGDYPLELQNFNLFALIISLFKPFSSLMEQLRITHSFKIDPEIPELLYGDPRALSRIISNLLDNATKFTSNGSIQLNITPEEITPEEIRLLFTLSDTGIGIPIQKQSALFHPFSRLESPHSSNTPGVGLGLSIASLLVQQMGGRIWLNSIPGAGTTFYFTISLKYPV